MGDPSVWDGTLTLNDFSVSAAAFAERWKEINPSLPQWTWARCQGTGASSSAEGYLTLESMHCFNTGEEIIGEENCSAEEPFDSATLIPSYNDDMHTYDFHIVYSFSYRVPVLYFRGYKSDGHPLPLEDIEKELPPYSLNILKESKWTFMTQEEHPYLHRPWYTLHPCGTSDWMKLLLQGSLPAKDREIVHYIPAWLSVAGQAVGLRIPLELHIKQPARVNVI